MVTSSSTSVTTFKPSLGSGDKPPSFGREREDNGVADKRSPSTGVAALCARSHRISKRARRARLAGGLIKVQRCSSTGSRCSIAPSFARIVPILSRRCSVDAGAWIRRKSPAPTPMSSSVSKGRSRRGLRKRTSPVARGPGANGALDENAESGDIGWSGGENEQKARQGDKVTCRGAHFWKANKLVPRS